MRKAVLLYNPDSGGHRAHRLKEVRQALSIVRSSGVEAELVLTESIDHAGEHAARAIQSGCDTVFACGGDGTIHNIIQVLAKTPVALAILPMGTGNTLAHDLRIPLKAAPAAATMLTAKPKRVAVGQVNFRDFSGNSGSRYFVITAGLGVDAHLFYRLDNSVKKRFGMTAYYLKAWHLWATYHMTRFRVDYWPAESNEKCSVDLTELMAVRIRNFGGVLRELAPGASLDRDDLRLVLCRTSSRVAYLMYVARSLLGVNRRIPGIDLAFSNKASCPVMPSDSPPIYVEADGELLGTLPVEISIVPDALTLLTPSQHKH